MSTPLQTVMHAAHKQRLKNLLALVGEGQRFNTQQDLASALDVSAAYLSQFIGDKPARRISEVSARKFEYKLKLASGALDRRA